MRSIKTISIVFLVVMLSACTISQNVSPVGEAIFIEKVYVKDNPKSHMKELVNELVTQIDELGFYSEKFEGNRPLDATHYLEYTANWAWDMAMYLTFFEAKLYDGGKLIGEVSYDARRGGGNMGKFGRTAEKIKPLLTELFEEVERPKK